MVILATFVRIVTAILQTEDSTSQSEICLSGLSIGCEINKVFPKSQKQAVIVREPSKVTSTKYSRLAQPGKFKNERKSIS